MMPLSFILWFTPTPQVVTPSPTNVSYCEEVRVELKRGVRNLYLSRKQARNIYNRCLYNARFY